MKTILPWILVVAFGASAGALYFSSSNKEAELEKVRAQVQQVDAMRGQLEELQKQASAQNDQIAAMRKDNEELLRLRGQVRQLTDDKAQLTKQLSTAQSQADRSQAEVQQVQSRVNESANAIAQQRILQMKQSQEATAVCINNLRMLDGAKQQWALEQHKAPNAVPTPPDIAPYFAGGQIPQCPSGGRYTLNAVNVAPSCSIPGHVLQ